MKKKIYVTPQIEVGCMDMSPVMNGGSPLHTNGGLKLDSNTGDAGGGRSRDFFDDDDYADLMDSWNE